ncbi:hypothetical protein ACFO0N_01605 [Halobium salinum]|uniref:Uncharacterized protein n=1 Tax=Halobium salinum TaxID=1364940 RepID=A0ABD5P723_9EURY|nr:hypothetical protein [Halobium salinum]
MSADAVDRPGVAGRLDRFRESHYAAVALVAVTLLGFVAVAVHWAGFLAVGALLGLLSATLSRAAVHGLTFGGLVLLGFGGWLALSGALATWTSLGLLFGLSAGAALGLPTLAAVGVRALR